jgi:AcrR family transcriptional regulator
MQEVTVSEETVGRRERDRQRREQEIIGAAARLFVRDGYSTTTMEAIGAEAEFTKRTLYKYFVNKEDLFYAALLKGEQLKRDYFAQAFERSGSTLEKMRRVGQAYYGFSRDYPEFFRLMNFLGAVKREAGSTPCPHRERFFERDLGSFDGYIALVKQGIAEGSIRSDLDATQTAYVVTFMLNSFFTNLAATGRGFLSHFGLEQETFVNAAIELLFSALAPGAEKH